MTKENIETICQMIEDNNSLSINCIALEVGIDKNVWLILQKKLKLHPYKQHDVLDLSDRKKEGKVEFCTGAAYCTGGLFLIFGLCKELLWLSHNLKN